MDGGEIGRKRLFHQVPQGVVGNPEGDVFFITICCLPRGENQLARQEIWEAVRDTFLFREAKGELDLRLLLVMPDHLHGLFRFGGGKSMSKVITDAKSWLAKSSQLRWQRDYFDHRLRSTESAAEKGAYIRMNPVRAGLVEDPDQWPFVLDRVR